MAAVLLSPGVFLALFCLAEAQDPVTRWLGHSDRADVETAQRENVAMAKILRNVGAETGAGDGLVIASPSTADPDYYVSLG